MIFKHGFIDRIEQAICRDLSTFEKEQLNIGLTEHDLVYDKVKRDAPLDDWDWLPRYYDISEAKAWLQIDVDSAWLYDRHTHTLITNLESGSHEVLMGLLYQIYKSSSEYDVLEKLDITTDAQSYFDEGFGMFCTSAAQMYECYKSDSCTLNAQEKMAFRDIKFHNFMR
jgi:hypothetical protein